MSKKFKWKCCEGMVINVMWSDIDGYKTVRCPYCRKILPNEKRDEAKEFYRQKHEIKNIRETIRSLLKPYLKKPKKILSAYKFMDDSTGKSMKFITIEKVNKNGERIFVTNRPIERPDKALKVANIVDRPEETEWTYKESHIESIDSTFKAYNYLPVNTSGSFCVPSGTFVVSKECCAQIVLLPLNPTSPNNLVKNCEIIGNMKNSGTVVVSIDAPTWMGYVTTSRQSAKYL